MADQKMNWNINLAEIRYLEVSDITNYRLKFIIATFKSTYPIWRTEKINK